MDEYFRHRANLYFADCTVGETLSPEEMAYPTDKAVHYGLMQTNAKYARAFNSYSAANAKLKAYAESEESTASPLALAFKKAIHFVPARVAEHIVHSAEDKIWAMASQEFRRIRRGMGGQH